MSASKACESFEVLILGRLVFGLFCGLVMSLNPLYIQEVSPTNLRGAFATLNQVSFASGILVGMVSRKSAFKWKKLVEVGVYCRPGFWTSGYKVRLSNNPVFFFLQVAGLETVLGTEHFWAMMLSLSLIPALIQYLVLPFCPESPRYLLINRGEESKAEAGEKDPLNIYFTPFTSHES